MKKHVVLVLTFLLFAFGDCWANVITGQAAIPDHYYDGVDGKSGVASILSALNTIIKGHTVINYDGLEPYYQQTDFYGDTLWDMYSTCRFTAEDANQPQSAVCDGWNKEHVCCQSWLGNGDMVSDLFNVYPTDARVNNLRSNFPYGETNVTTGITKDPDKHALGKLGTSKNGPIANYSTSSNYTDGNKRVFEPDDQYKGDFARTFFYMVARYRENVLNAGNGSAMFVSNPTDFTAYSVSFLLKWHRQDPVSLKEIDRNQAVYGIQHNRNPFIDYPDLVEYVWGDKKGQTVNLASLTPSCDEVTPYIETNYGVTWKVFGQVLRVDSVKNNGKVSSFPSEPTSCSQTSNVFVGWTTNPIANVSQQAPSPLFTTKAQAPVVTGDVTYYAVFAHAEKKDGIGEVTASTNFSSYNRGNEVTSEQIGKVTATFDKAAAGTKTTYYTEVRCYAGSTITFTGATMSKIVFTAGTNDKGNELKPNAGSISGATWTGNTSSVTFTVGGESGYRGISAIDVTYNDNAVITTYSDYLTSCDGSSMEVQHVQKQQSVAQKVLIDGKLYILIGEKIFTITGQQIK